MHYRKGNAMARQNSTRRSPELPSKALINRFIHFYTTSVAFKDEDRAGRMAHIEPRLVQRIMKDGEIRQEIDRKLSILEIEQAKLEAHARLLTVGVLDSALFEEVRSKKNGSVRIRAIELGYKRTGLIRDGEFYVAPDPAANQNAPSIYQAQTTVKRTVTEEVTQTRAVAAAVQPPRELPAPGVEILEY
jgi:hypothetical protein